MKKSFLTLITLLVITSVNAQSSWKVDKSHSSVTFSISHFMISEVTGNFGSFDIEAKTNDNFEKPVFDVSIDAATINTNQAGRDKHLKSADFFNVVKFPKIIFKSGTFKQLEEGNFETVGEITIKGITKEVIFKGKLNGVIKDDRSGKFKAGLKLTAAIEREVFEIGKGMAPLGKKVNVVVNIEMNQQ